MPQDTVCTSPLMSLHAAVGSQTQRPDQRPAACCQLFATTPVRSLAKGMRNPFPPSQACGRLFSACLSLWDDMNWGRELLNLSEGKTQGFLWSVGEGENDVLFFWRRRKCSVFICPYPWDSDAHTEKTLTVCKEGYFQINKCVYNPYRNYVSLEYFSKVLKQCDSGQACISSKAVYGLIAKVPGTFSHILLKYVYLVNIFGTKLLCRLSYHLCHQDFSSIATSQFKQKVHSWLTAFIILWELEL